MGIWTGTAFIKPAEGIAVARMIEEQNRVVRPHDFHQCHLHRAGPVAARGR